MLKHLHGDFGRHPGITAAIINFRSKYYYPNMPKIIPKLDYFLPEMHQRERG